MHQNATAQDGFTLLELVIVIVVVIILVLLLIFMSQS